MTETRSDVRRRRAGTARSAALVAALALLGVTGLSGATALATSGRTYTQQAYLKAASVGTNDWHGQAVDLDGDIAVVGAPTYSGSGTAGKVTVYVRDDSTWALEATLTASDTPANDVFGTSVAIDGDTLAVGNPRAGTSGQVYVFTRSDEVWTERAIIAGTVDDGRLFGTSVDLDGGTLVVGGIWDGSGGTTIGGAITVLTGADATWTRQAVLTSSNGDANDQLGTWVAIDGDTIVGGAYLEDGDGTDPENDGATSAGAAYVFVRTGTTWTQQAYLKAPSPDASDNFGNGVAVDGDTVLVGAPGDDDQGGGAGAVHVFTRTGTTWTHRTTLYASDVGANGNFGSRVALQDGTAAVARQSGASDGGGVYLLVGAGATWTEEAIVRGDNAAAGDQNGTDVAIDGETVLVGAYREDSAATGVDPVGPPGPDDDSVTSAGAAYAIVSSDWTPTSAGGSVEPTAAVSLLALGGPETPAVAGGALRVPVTGGDPGIDILWRVRDAEGDVVLEGPVTLASDGSGLIDIVLPSTLTGTVELELVAWDVVRTLEVRSLVPTRIPAGGAPSGDRAPMDGGGAAVVIVLGLVLAITPAPRARRRNDVSSRPV